MLTAVIGTYSLILLAVLRRDTRYPTAHLIVTTAWGSVFSLLLSESRLRQRERY